MSRKTTPKFIEKHIIIPYNASYFNIMRIQYNSGISVLRFFGLRPQNDSGATICENLWLNFYNFLKAKIL